MKIGVLGTGLMGSSLIECLSSKGVEVLVYNRTKRKALDVCRRFGCTVVDEPRELCISDAVIVFVYDDNAVMDVFMGPGGLLSSHHPILLLNSSTVSPELSLRIEGLATASGHAYYEAPVYGSVDEATSCSLTTMIAGRMENAGRAMDTARLFSKIVHYIGEVPKASALKLSLNNIGLALPPIIGESLAILEAYNVPVELFTRVAGGLWFSSILERYMGRIMKETRRVRFTVDGASKDYRLISKTLAEKGYPSTVSSALMNYYSSASMLRGLGRTDYPRAALSILKKQVSRK